MQKQTEIIEKEISYLEENIAIKDFIDSIKNEGGEYEILTENGFAPIGNLYIKNNKKCFEIVLENGLILKASEDHLVKTNNKYLYSELLDGSLFIRLKNINIGDEINTSIGITKVVEKNEIGIHTTYDVEVETDQHTYLSNKIISHNTGKTAITEGLAKKIVERKVSVVLHDKRIVALDLSLIIAGTKYRGQFEERMKAIMEEIELNPDVIVFVDELHTIMGAGNAVGSLDVSNMIKPALARGVMQMIGATTIDEYKKSIEKDGAMERRFQKVFINPPSVEETRIILENIKENYEKHHNVKYSPESLDAAVNFSDRYITTRFFPDKAIDIIDEVGAKIHIDNLKPPEKLLKLQEKLTDLEKQKKSFVVAQKYEDAATARDTEKKLLNEIDIVKKIWEAEEKAKESVIVKEEDVAKVVSKMIGIPVSKITEDEGLKLIKMPEVLKERVVGQDEAVEKVSEAIQRSRAGISNPTRPICSLLFMGNSGTGKTELSKALAEYMFNDPESLIKIDMSEYMEQHSVSRMIGSPPGYVGYEEGGQLTEKIRNKPYSVVLFDEVEKAHRDVLNVLLQVLDEGKLTDGMGRTVNFKNTIIIMTSNIGTRELNENKPVGFTSNDSMDKYNIINKALKKHFRPEFLNRIDEQVVFNKLTEENVKKISEIHINNFLKSIEKQGYKIEVTENVVKFIAKEGFSDEFGARPILRAITMYIQNQLSKEILLKNVKIGEQYLIDFDEKERKIIVNNKKKKSKT